MDRRRVVITGLGAVTPIGLTALESWQAVKNGVCGVAPITQFDPSGMKVKLAAEVKGFEAETLLGRQEAKRMGRFTQFAVVAAREAISDAGFDIKNADPDRCGVIISSGIGGLSITEAEHDKGKEKGWDRVSPFYIPTGICNMAAGQVAIDHGFKGMCTCPVTACAGGTNAVGDAFHYIRDGYADVMLCGGTEASVTPLAIGGFTSMKALSQATDPNRASIPFDAERSGFVLGEGAGVLLLEELEHALARGAKIYAEITGYGATCDAYHMTAPLPDGSGGAKAMALALSDGQTNPDSVDYINAHGTSTHLNDAGETAAVKTLMSTASDDDPKVALAIIYGLSYKEDSASGVKITSKALPFSLSTDSAVQKSYAKGHLDSSVTNGIVFTLRGQDVLTLSEIRLENMNLPPRDIMEKIYFIAPTDINDDEAFGIFQNLFAGPKPLIGLLSLKDLKTNSALLDISLDKLNITNPSTSPYALEVSLEHLKMPVALVPELQLLSVMGVPEIDASASYAISLPNKDNQFNSTASLSVAKLGTADFAVKGEVPYKDFFEIINNNSVTDSDIENFVEKNIKFSHIEAGYADEGLLPRLGILGQKFMGLTPEQCVDMAKKYVKESLGAAEGTENTAKLMEYIDKPGAIRLIFNTEKPIPVEAFDTLSDTDPSIKLDVNTGPKTALELMADLEKK